jgi:two-component system chemotaxis response regulator CheY
MALSNRAAQPLSAGGSSTLERGRTMKKVALVVDDSLVIRKLVLRTLAEADFEVLTAANGKDALDQATGKQLALVITDFNMPTMNGLELIRALRQLEEHKFTPIVFLTTEIDEQLQNEARASGASAWIQKPFTPEKVLSVVSRIAG